ncbi:MAG: hypothetical protein HY000_36140 [Planctomycetes bacterium]|nr:hypothetical protein [Planctomycetota bacterium]
MKRSITLLAVTMSLSFGTSASAQTLLNPVGPPMPPASQTGPAYPHTVGEGSALNGTMYGPPSVAGDASEWQGAPCEDCGSSYDGCGDLCCAPSQPAWFGSVTGLIMSRDRANALWTTFETNNNPNQLMSTQDADADWAGGAEIAVGRWWCQSGLQFSIFGLDTLEGFASVRDTNNLLSTPLDLTTQTGDILIGARPAGDFFDNAREHRISRRDDIWNIELNYLYQPMLGVPSRFQVTWLGGVRWFRFDERLIFASVAGDGAVVNAGGSEFGNNLGIDEAYLRSRAQNDLVGPQIGAWANYYITPRFSMFAQPKFGIYGNSISVRSHLYSGDGITAFDYSGSKTDVSFLGQVDLGATIQLTDNWRLRGGYRAIAVSGIALSDEQIPHFLAAADEFQQVDSNGSLILHGAFVGADWRF